MSSSDARLPGSSANTGSAAPSLSCARVSRRDRVVRRGLRERMADERHRHAGGLVDRRLERKQRQHPVDAAADLRDALAAPRPHRRAHEMDRAHAAALELALEAEVEVRRVDADEDRHALGERGAARARGGCGRARAAGRRPRRSRAPRAFPADTTPRTPRPPSSARRCRRSAPPAGARARRGSAWPPARRRRPRRRRCRW